VGRSAPAPGPGPLVLGRAKRLHSNLRAVLEPHDANDVILNQPGRALLRCILWALVAVGFSTLPLGAVALQVARVHAFNSVFAKLAGLFLSGSLLQLLVSVVAAVCALAFPVLRPGRVPRPSSERPTR
jgi:hypothetical protein